MDLENIAYHIIRQVNICQHKTFKNDLLILVISFFIPSTSHQRSQLNKALTPAYPSVAIYAFTLLSM